MGGKYFDIIIFVKHYPCYLSLVVVVVVAVTTVCSGEAISTISKLDYRHSYVPHYDIAHWATLETLSPYYPRHLKIKMFLQHIQSTNN